jgi:hypothetical protein
MWVLLDLEVRLLFGDVNLRPETRQIQRMSSTMLCVRMRLSRRGVVSGSFADNSQMVAALIDQAQSQE